MCIAAKDDRMTVTFAERQAADLWHRLGTIAEDWDRPEARGYGDP